MPGMLRYIGQPQPAGRIDKALSQVLAAKRDVPRDLGGDAFGLLTALPPRILISFHVITNG